MTTRVAAIVQARMTSRRLPGKTLMEIGGVSRSTPRAAEATEPADREHVTSFISSRAYGGLSAWEVSHVPTIVFRCGDAAVIDSYEVPVDEIEALARRIPVAAIWRRRARGMAAALVARGASERARRLVDVAVRSLRAMGIADVVHAPVPGGLSDAIRSADVAASAADLTAYELACAGAPTVLVAVADNHVPSCASSSASA